VVQIGLNLFQQHRREVHHRTGIRVGFQVRSHVHIILDAVQIDPGEQELPIAVILIIRLVHMPAKYHWRAGVRGHGDNPARASRE